VKWLALILASIGAFVVYKKVSRKLHVGHNRAKDTTRGRTPGDNSGAFVIHGSLDSGGSFAVPPIAGGYGAVGIATGSPEEYVAAPLDNNVPSFLQGATGGVADPAMTGDAPRESLRLPPLARGSRR
jgi:hypothetical protein